MCALTHSVSFMPPRNIPDGLTNTLKTVNFFIKFFRGVQHLFSLYRNVQINCLNQLNNYGQGVALHFSATLFPRWLSVLSLSFPLSMGTVAPQSKYTVTLRCIEPGSSHLSVPVSALMLRPVRRPDCFRVITSPYTANGGKWMVGGVSGRCFTAQRAARGHI